MPQHPYLIQLKSASNLFLDQKKYKACQDTIDYYSNIYTASDALDSVLKILDKLAQVKRNGQVLSDKGHKDLDLDMAFFDTLKVIFYASEKNFKDLDNLPEFTENFQENLSLLKEWSEINLQKILNFVQNKNNIINKVK